MYSPTYRNGSESKYTFKSGFMSNSIGEWAHFTFSESVISSSKGNPTNLSQGLGGNKT